MEFADPAGTPGRVTSRTGNGLEVTTIGSVAALEEWSSVLDRMAPARGPHADVYDSASWLLAWLAPGPETLERGLRVLVAHDDDRAVAMLPLFARSTRDWTIAGDLMRPRFRPVIDRPDPDARTIDALERLVARAARDGMRTLELPAVPSEDPVTPAMIAALERVGFRVRRHRTSADTLSTVGACDWDRFRRRFKVFESNVRRRERKASRIGEVALRAWTSEAGEGSVGEGFSLYRRVHAQSWKGTMHSRTERHRAALVTRAARRGWVEVLGLFVAGVPASAHLWFRLGARAISYSTVYDARLAALGAGSMLVWKGIERMVARGGLEVIDFLPGRGAQKEELATSRPALLGIEARRGVSLAVSSSLGRAARAARRPVARCAALVASVTRSKGCPRISRTHVSAEPGGGGPVAPLDLEPTSELYLAAAGGFRSVRKMREAWGEGDRWLVLGEPPLALARVDAAGAPRELVLLGEGVSLAEAARRLASALRRALDDDLVVHRAVLPWPHVTPSSTKGETRRDRTPAHRA